MNNFVWNALILREFVLEINLQIIDETLLVENHFQFELVNLIDNIAIILFFFLL